jgi:HPr kinase/phosphorylase
MVKQIKVLELVEHFTMEVLVGESGLKRVITVADLYRPGLELAGYFDYFPSERIQMMGRTEISFLSKLSVHDREHRAVKLCQHADTPCIIVTRGLEVPHELVEEATKQNLPLLRNNLPTTIFASKLTDFLEKKLAPYTSIHGVLVDIYGIGILITGSSGIGKSETALELVKRGHRLIADDAVEIRQTADRVLTGNAPELIRHLLEIRGVGIINVMTLFGAGAVRNATNISLVIQLENWQDDKQYDRLGIDEETTRIIDVNLPLVTVPVKPGRNLAVIIEVAAMNYRLKRMGYNAALQFTNKLTQSLNEDVENLE